MRRAFLASLSALVLMVSSGCGLCDHMFCWHKPYGGCGNGCDGGCANGGCANGGCADGSGGPQDGYAHGGVHTVPRGVGGEYLGAAGPPTGAVAYPYYTSRGPRDFLDPNPPSIGP
jgi:hypothetical protein